jgi:hypothetical protein
MHGNFNKRADRDLQEQPSSSTKNSFADETPEQQAKHREIARRHQLRKRSGPKRPLIPNLRKRELERLFLDRCGKTLPDDDAGRDYLRLMADHLAQLGEHYITSWARVWAPWATDDDLDTLIEVVGPGKHWKANALAKELNLNDATRTRLKIRTIGAVDRSKAQRAKRCRKRKAAAEVARRAKVGAVPHALSAARAKPWEALGISRRTYYRNRANGTVGTNSCPILLESQWDTKQCQGGPSRVSSDTLARADYHGHMNTELREIADDLSPRPAIETGAAKQKRDAANAGRLVGHMRKEETVSP